MSPKELKKGYNEINRGVDETQICSEQRIQQFLIKWINTFLFISL